MPLKVDVRQTGSTSLVGPFDAEDVLSTAFLAAVTSRSWASVVNKRAYLFRSVANTAQNWHRSDRNRRSRERLVALDRCDVDRTEHVEVLALLSCLTVRQRSVIWVSYWLDASDREVANLLGISVRTVERELRKARRQLHKELT
ncbi:MAG: hypothetical protein CL424_03705 [Acidimicrobiaceae bacterium]|nr:hypothetical protein [Acidimicrobiaceae bacterium]